MINTKIKMQNSNNTPQNVSYYGANNASEDMVGYQPLTPGTAITPQVITPQEFTQIPAPEDELLESEYVEQQKQSTQTENNSKTIQHSYDGLKPKKANKLPYVIGFATMAFILLMGTGTIVFNRTKKSVVQTPVARVEDQSVAFDDVIKRDAILETINSSGSNRKLIVNGDFVTTGNLGIFKKGKLGEISTQPLSSNRKYILPDTSGEICLSANNCNYALTTSLLNQVGAINSQGKSANGAIISGNSIFLQTADVNNVGLVSTGAQIFSGSKTFTALGTGLNVVNNATIGSLEVGSTGVAGSAEKFRVNTPSTIDNSATTIIATGADNRKALVLQANSGSQSANLLEFQAANGTVLGYIDQFGRYVAQNGNFNFPSYTFGGSSNTGLFQTSNVFGKGIMGIAVTGVEVARFAERSLLIGSAGIPGAVERLRVNSPSTIDDAASSIISTGGAARKGLVIQGVSLQSANLQEWQDSNGTVLASIDINGVANLEAISLVSVGTQNGNVICDISNNCGFAGGANAFIQGGNSFGETASLGTNDTFDLVFKTDGLSRVTIDTSGNVGISSAPNGSKLYVPYQTGDLGGTTSSNNVFGSGTMQALLFAGDSTNINNDLTAIVGESYSASGVAGNSIIGPGVIASSQDSYGVLAVSTNSTGVLGFSLASGSDYAGVQGTNWNDGYGVRGDGVSLFGASNAIGVGAFGTNNYGLYASSSGNTSAYFQASGRVPTCFPFVCPIPPPTVYPTVPTVIIQQLGSRTEDLLEVQMSDNTPVFQIGYNGHTAIGNVSAIDDSTLVDTVGDYQSVLTIEENVTNDLSTTENTYGQTILMNFNPSVGSVGNVGGQYIVANSDALSTENFANLTGSYVIANHSGSGTVGSLFGSVVGAQSSNAAATMNNIVGGQVYAFNQGSTVSDFRGTDVLAINVGGTVSSLVGSKIWTGNTGVVNDLKGLQVNNSNNWFANGTATTMTGIEVTSATGGAPTDNFGINVMSQTLGTNSYGIAIGTAGTQTLWLQGDDATANSGIGFGSTRDTNLYRSAADTLKTDDNFLVQTITNSTTALDVKDNSGMSALSVDTTNGGNGVLRVNGENTRSDGDYMGIVSQINVDTIANQSCIGGFFGCVTAGYNTTIITDSANSFDVSTLMGSISQIDHQGSGSVGTSIGDIVSLQSTGSGSIEYGYGYLVLQVEANHATGMLINAISGNTEAVGLSVTGVGASGGDAIGIKVDSVTTGINTYGITIASAGTQTLVLGSEADNTTANAGIAFGISRDTNLYRSAAGTLQTDDSLVVANNLGVNNTTAPNRLNVNTLTTANSDAQIAVSTGTTTGIGVVVQGVASQTANLQEWQSSTGVVLASVSSAGDLTVIDATINGTLTVNGDTSINGHIVSGNSSGSTAIAAGAGAGAGAGVSLSGNDTAGKIAITTGTGSGSGVMATVTFANSFGSAPRVILTPSNGNGASIQYFAGNSSTATFTIDTNNAPVDVTTYEYYYHVIE